MHPPCQWMHLFLVCVFFGSFCKQERDMLERKANKQWRPETALLSVGNVIQPWVSVSGFSHNNASIPAVTFGCRRIQMYLKGLMLLHVTFFTCSCLWEVDPVLSGCRSVLSILALLCLAAPLACHSRTTVLKPLTFPYPYLNGQFSKTQHPQISCSP